MSLEKVLLVDDEEDFVNALSERLEARGLEVSKASNGKEAVDRSNKDKYDAVILDLQMPEMDGMETLKVLLKENPDMQIVLLTGHATVSKGIEAMKFGAMDFLEKPVDFDKLMNIIKEASAKKMILTEKKIQEELKNILTTRGW